MGRYIQPELASPLLVLGDKVAMSRGIVHQGRVDCEGRRMLAELALRVILHEDGLVSMGSWRVYLGRVPMLH